MAADPHKYPYIFGWAFREVRGNWIHILRRQVRETRDASGTELRDMALAMFMPPVLQDYHQDATQCGVRGGGSAGVSSTLLNVVSYTGTMQARGYGYGLLAGNAAATTTGVTATALPVTPQSMISASGTLLAVDGATSSNTLNVSTDWGNNWTNSTAMMPTTATWTGLGKSGNRIIATAYDSTAIAISLDGQSWFAGGSLPSIQDWNTIAGNGDSNIFVAITRSNQVSAYSVNGGLTWVSGGATPAGTYWNMLEYIGSVFVAGSVNGTSSVLTSPGGASWSTITLPSTPSATWYGPYKANGYLFMVAGIMASTDKMLYSVNGSTWNTVTLPVAGLWSSVYYLNGKYHAFNRDTLRIYSSANLTSWAEISPQASGLSASALYDCALVSDDSKSAAVLSHGNGNSYVQFYASAQDVSYAGMVSTVCGGAAAVVFTTQSVSITPAGGAVSAASSIVLAVAVHVIIGGAVAGGAAAEGVYLLSTGATCSVAGGAAPEGLYSVSAGGAVASGVAPEGFYVAAIGGAVAGGVAPEGLAQVVIGGAVSGGAADANIQTSSQIYTHIVAGGAVASVTSGMHVMAVPVMSGGAVSAAVSVVVALAVKAGLVTALAGGAAVELTGQVAAGGAVAGGTAPFLSNTLANEYSYTSAGGSVAGGVAENIQYAYPATTGAAVASGGIVVQVTAAVPVAGGAVAAGDAVLLQSVVRAVVGGAVALPAGDTSIGWTGDKTVQTVAGGAAGIVASIALYGSVTAVASGGVTVRATAYADSYGGAVGGGAAPFIGYGVLQLVVTAAAVAGGAGRVSSMIFSPSIDITWSVEDLQPRFTGSSADNRFSSVDTQIRFTGG